MEIYLAVLSFGAAGVPRRDLDIDRLAPEQAQLFLSATARLESRGNFNSA